MPNSLGSAKMDEEEGTTSVTAKNQKPNLRPRKIQSANLLIWSASGFYLLAMVWFLLLRWANTAHLNLSRGSRQQLSGSRSPMAFS